MMHWQNSYRQKLERKQFPNGDAELSTSVAARRAMARQGVPVTLNALAFHCRSIGFRQRHEVEFILSEAGKYLAQDPTESDVLACFSGLRPLVKHGSGTRTAKLSRSHTVIVSPSGLVTITGGKWTTYRYMGEDCINHFEQAAGVEHRPSRTSDLALHGSTRDPAIFNAPEHLACYGSDRPEIETRARANATLAEPIHPALPYLTAEVDWAIENEMARTVEDILARRTRSLLLDAKAAAEAAPKVAELLAIRLGRDKVWAGQQAKQFQALAENYKL